MARIARVNEICKDLFKGKGIAVNENDDRLSVYSSICTKNELCKNGKSYSHVQAAASIACRN